MTIVNEGYMMCCCVSMTTMCCVQLVEQCEDEELMDIVLPRLTKMLSLWELLLAKVHTHTYTQYSI